jgi:glycerophosphoryl diester phosphodiesterase
MGGTGRLGVARAGRVVAALVVATIGLAPGVTAAGAADADEPAPKPAAPLVIAHRGASAAAPEHTFAAYDRAVADHADVIECDLQLTKDGVLVCLHDTTVDRTTGGTATGRIDSFTLEELRAMDFGAWFGPEFAGATVVPFEEQLRCYGNAGVRFYAETKAPAEYGGKMEPALVALLRRLDLVPRGKADVDRAEVIVQSFDLGSLQAVKRLAPSLPTAWLWVTPPAEAPADGTMPPGVDVMAPTDTAVLANPGLVAVVHTDGGKVHTWTVDDPAEMEQLLDLGVDGIFTNQPGVLRGIVDRRTGQTARPAVDRAAGCPGIAGTVTAASTGARDLAPSPQQPPAPAVERAADEGSIEWGAVAIALGALVVVAGIIVWVLGRRHPR